MKYVIDLGKVAYDNPEQKTNAVEVTVELKPAQKVAPYLTIDFKPIPEDAVKLSICGAILNSRHIDHTSGGQIDDKIKLLFPDNKSVQRLCEIWDRWHLNGMHAGCRIQEEALREFKYDPKNINRDTQAFEFLRACDGYEVSKPGGGTYKYGEAWLFEEIPAEVIEELHALIGALGGKAS